ncbi:hypothetical protein HMPREF1170_02789 [Aeromonas veronii AMC35]|nr:hypothetical protein HMPREF1170_02789 [Aeromonas veronii AMC35]
MPQPLKKNLNSGKLTNNEITWENNICQKSFRKFVKNVYAVKI